MAHPRSGESQPTVAEVPHPDALLCLEGAPQSFVMGPIPLAGLAMPSGHLLGAVHQGCQAHPHQPLAIVVGGGMACKSVDLPGQMAVKDPWNGRQLLEVEVAVALLLPKARMGLGMSNWAEGRSG